MVMLQAMFIFHAKVSMAKIWTNEVIQKEKESVLPFKNFEMTIMHGKKVRYSESRIAHFHGVAMSKRGKLLYCLNLYNYK